MTSLKINDLKSDDNVDISILQFLKLHSSPAIEINNIKANRDISVKVDQFFHTIRHYQELQSKIIKQEEAITDSKNNDNEAKQYLNELYELLKKLKVDVILLADIFLNLSITSIRLEKARTLFEQGYIEEANNILDETDLSNDQENLLIAADYLEYKKRHLTN
ncbi:MAG: hypothetical protein ABIN91_09225 [Mucilaginibacter sp.]|uniref:hypothetical protein n=1 Tax=Mucilaginibacter sp. TaxID=1882438 RepID=UPI003267352D